MVVTTDKGVHTEKGVRNVAIQLSYGKCEIPNDNIAVEISHKIVPIILAPKDDQSYDKFSVLPKTFHNPIAVTAQVSKKKNIWFMLQKNFGKTIVFTAIKIVTDELVSGGVFNMLTAQKRQLRFFLSIGITHCLFCS